MEYDCGSQPLLLQDSRLRKDKISRPNEYETIQYHYVNLYDPYKQSSMLQKVKFLYKQTFLWKYVNFVFYEQTQELVLPLHVIWLKIKVTNIKNTFY